MGRRLGVLAVNGVVACALVAVATSPADAALLVADPDVFAASLATSPPIGHSFDGVTLSTNVNTGDVLALGAANPGDVAGWYPAVFGHYGTAFPPDGSTCGGCWSFGFAVLKADFVGAVSFVDVDFIDRFAGSAIVEAYDSSNQLLSRREVDLVGHDEVNATRLSIGIGSPKSNIAYILAGANFGTYGVIDRISWITSVPEPTTLALTLAAIVASAWSGRRRIR